MTDDEAKAKALWESTRWMSDLHPRLSKAEIEEMSFPRIRWRGEEYILVDGAITTRERFAADEMSVAHFYPEDDCIMQWRKQVGTAKDIEFLP